MVQIDDVKAACARLAPLGWQTLLQRHGLDITRGDLAAELSRDLAVDRSIPGFEDFTLVGKRGIEPGLPAASLLYHAFASPNVHPTASGEPAASEAYPTLLVSALSTRRDSPMLSSAFLPMNTGRGTAPRMAITRI